MTSKQLLLSRCGIALVVLLSLGGCELDLTNPNAPTEEAVFTSIEGIIAAAVVDQIVNDARLDRRACFRVTQPGQPHVLLPRQAPGRKQHVDPGAGRTVGILVAAHIQPPGVGGVDHGQGLFTLAPGEFAHRLVMGYLGR